MKTLLEELIARANVDPQLLGGTIVLICDRCQQPLYLLQRAQVLDPAQAVPLTRLAETAGIPGFIALSFAAYQAWPETGVMSLSELKQARDLLEQRHTCSPGATP